MRCRNIFLKLKKKHGATLFFVLPNLGGAFGSHQKECAPKALGGGLQKISGAEGAKRGGGHQNIAPKAIRGGASKIYGAEGTKGGGGYQKNAPEAQTTQGVVKVHIDAPNVHCQNLRLYNFRFLCFDFAIIVAIYA